MGELGITITDLGACPRCDQQTPMIFEDAKSGWYITCWNGQCQKKTKHHAELLDAADEWGIV
jgi:hypothetical protein